MSVVDDIYKVVKNVLALAHDIHSYQSDLKEIRHEVRDLTLIVQRLSQELQHSKELRDNERTNTLLEVENQLLRLEHKLFESRKHSPDYSKQTRPAELRLSSANSEVESSNPSAQLVVRTPKAKRAKT